MRARYYSPEIMRFISEDTYKGSLNNPLTLNYYGYCWRNQVMLYDPSGNWPDFGKLLKGVVAVTIGVFAIGTAGAAVGAVAAVTMEAGTALTMMGVADIDESFTGQNEIKEVIFDGNEENYDTAEEILAMVATSGFSSAKLGKNKIVDFKYKPLEGDKANIFLK